MDNKTSNPFNQEVEKMVEKKMEAGGKRIALIACSKSKQDSDQPIEACELYTGNTFKKSKEAIEKGRFKCEKYYIISAKHDLLDKSTEISRYDETLYCKDCDERKAWAEKVLSKLREEKCNLDKDVFYIFGGSKYYEYLKLGLNCVVFDYKNSNAIDLDNYKAYFEKGREPILLRKEWNQFND